ncbi:MAG: phosphate acyltransferase PlsX [Phycisphaeraceae bacterium]|nr:phosphate acyltransferase PlsX [Phycisphaeraceae bacterium]
MRLAVDVMGGDNAPEAIVKGCIEAISLLEGDDRLVLIGDGPVIREMLVDRGIRDDRLEIDHTNEVIEMHEPPTQAVKTKKDSSLVRMALLGSEKHPRRCDAVLSAGNTGACVAAAMMHMRRLPHVHRPGIAVTIPSFHGPVVLIDAGANPEPRSSHLWQYALMGETYARTVLGIQSPRIAQMNIGSEEAKGTGLTKETRELLKATPGVNYVGYIEGREFFEDSADVVITDGFTGNTLLKMAEGMASSLMRALAREIAMFDPNLLLQFEPIMKQLYKKHDYHEYGGAPLLGVNGVCLIAHGSSQARTIRSAVRACQEFVRSGVNKAIVQRLSDVCPRVETHQGIVGGHGGSAEGAERRETA